MVVIITSLSISGAMLLLVLYWLITKSFETVKTIFAMFGIMLGLALCIWLALNFQVRTAAWILIVFMVLLNLGNLLWYGIATPSAAAYIIPILLAMFCINQTAGYLITGLGCLIVFGIPYLQSKEKIKTFIPYQVSHLTFDAPVLSLVFCLATVLISSWIEVIKEILFLK